MIQEKNVKGLVSSQMIQFLTKTQKYKHTYLASHFFFFARSELHLNFALDFAKISKLSCKKNLRVYKFIVLSFDPTRTDAAFSGWCEACGAKLASLAF